MRRRPSASTPWVQPAFRAAPAPPRIIEVGRAKDVGKEVLADRKLERDLQDFDDLEV